MASNLRSKLAGELDAWQIAASGLRAAPLRTITVVLASAWGIMFLVFLYSIVSELKHADDELISGTSLGEITLKFETAMDGPIAEQLDRVQIPGTHLVPWVELKAICRNGPVYGVTRAFFSLDGFRVVRGNPMSLSDSLGRSRSCWVKSSVMEALEAEGLDPAGVIIGGISFKVAGVYEFQRRYHPVWWAEPMDPWALDPVLIPVATAAEILPDKLAPLNVFLRVHDTSALVNALDDIFITFEGLGLDTNNVVQGRERKWADFFREQHAKYAQVAQAYETIILIAALLSATNLMLAQRRRKIREIGVSKALGASYWKLFGHFMRESLMVGLLAGFVGAILGTCLSFVVGHIIDLQVTIDPNAIKLGLAVSLLASLIVGVAPAWLGARMDPVEALRHE